MTDTTYHNTTHSSKKASCSRLSCWDSCQLKMGVLVISIYLGAAMHWCWTVSLTAAGCRFGWGWLKGEILLDTKFKLMVAVCASQLRNLLLELVVSGSMKHLLELRRQCSQVMRIWVSGSYSITIPVMPLHNCTIPGWIGVFTVLLRTAWMKNNSNKLHLTDLKWQLILKQLILKYRIPRDLSNTICQKILFFVA